MDEFGVCYLNLLLHWVYYAFIILLWKNDVETTLSGNRTLGMTMKPIGPQSKNLFTFMANLGPNTN